MAVQEETKPKLPVLNIHDIIRWRQKVTDHMTPLSGERITAGDIQSITSFLTRELTKNRQVAIPEVTLTASAAERIRPAVYETVCAYTAGMDVDDRLIKTLAARVAGNVHRLRAGLPVLSFSALPQPEWALATILDAEVHHTPKKRIPGAMLRFSILSGLASGEELTQFFPEWMLTRMSKKLKLVKPRERRIVIPWELVKFKLALELVTDPELKAEHFVERQSLNKWNRELAESRNPTTRKCPGGYRFPCHMCPVGFLTCPMGTHREDYVERQCGNHRGHFPPNSTRRWCLRCAVGRWRAAR